jgi:hypothetical protein
MADGVMQVAHGLGNTRRPKYDITYGKSNRQGVLV